MYYTADVTAAFKEVWEASGSVCGELLHPVISDYLDIFIRDGMWNHSKEATRKLRSMSEGTVKNSVGKFMKARREKGKSTTNPYSIKGIVPVFCGPWNDVPVEHGQIDTAVHSGSTLAGDMIFSVSYTDCIQWVVEWTSPVQQRNGSNAKQFRHHTAEPSHSLVPCSP